MKDITEAAMECSVTVHQWGATRSDRELGNKVADENNGTKGAYTVVKNLINKRYLDPVTAAAGRIRKAHAKYTVPWLHDGTGLLPVTLYTKFMGEMLTLKGEFENAVHDLADQVDEIRDDKDWLGDGSVPLPSREWIIARHSVDVRMRPMRRIEEDFRISMNAEVIESMKEDYRKELQDQMSLGTASAYRRVVDVVTSLVDGLERHGKETEGKKKPGYFKNAVIDNVGALSEILDDLNVTGDPDLTQLSSNLRTRLTMFDPDTLREDDNLRAAVIEDAREILDSATQRSNSIVNMLGL